MAETSFSGSKSVIFSNENYTNLHQSYEDGNRKYVLLSVPSKYDRSILPLSIYNKNHAMFRHFFCMRVIYLFIFKYFTTSKMCDRSLFYLTII